MADGKTGRFRVVIMDDYEGVVEEVPAFKKLKARADVAVMRKKLENEEELGRVLKGTNAILLMRERSRFGEKELSLAPDLKLISQTGRTGFHLDRPAVTRRGVAIAATPGDSGISTVELTFALILALMRRIPEVDRRMRQEAWPALPGRLLEGKTLGLVGLGRLAKLVARIAQAFNLRLLATSKTLTPERARESGAECVSLEQLLKESDIVSVHVRLSDETRGLIGDKELALMKPGAILINTARGPIVSQAALVRALEKGRLGGAALDVFDEEPLPLDSPLRRFDNVVLTPHRGYGTVEILSERYEEAINNILNFLDGKPTDLINPEVLKK